MTDIKGYCDPRFVAVREALAALLVKEDVGASAAVYIDGEPVVDIWGGYADAGRSVSWERDTLTGVNSTTKNMTALCALVLADRGELDLSAPVAAYWPEFAAVNGRTCWYGTYCRTRRDCRTCPGRRRSRSSTTGRA